MKEHWDAIIGKELAQRQTTWQSAAWQSASKAWQSAAWQSASKAWQSAAWQSASK